VPLTVIRTFLDKYTNIFKTDWFLYTFSVSLQALSLQAKAQGKVERAKVNQNWKSTVRVFEEFPP